MTVIPWADSVLVELHPNEEKQGRIIIPDSAKERNRIATVLAVGQGLRNSKTGERMGIDVKVGDVVILMHNKVEDQSAKGRMDQWLKDGQMIVGEHQIQAVIS